MSFVAVAVDCDFPLQNLPYGIFSTKDNVRDQLSSDWWCCCYQQCAWLWCALIGATVSAATLPHWSGHWRSGAGSVSSCSCLLHRPSPGCATAGQQANSQYSVASHTPKSQIQWTLTNPNSLRSEPVQIRSFGLVNALWTRSWRPQLRYGWNEVLLNF